jgi:hypothetical protein
VFTVEMTYGCTINDYLTNSQIVHAVSDTPTGTYTLAPVALVADTDDATTAVGADPNPNTHPASGAGNPSLRLPAPAATVFIAPFAHAPHVWKDPTTGALVVVFEGRQRLPDSAQKRCDRNM